MRSKNVKQRTTTPKGRTMDRAGADQIADFLVNVLSPTAEPSTVRDYYLTLRRRGKSAPEAVAMVIDDFIEELRTAVAEGQQYSERHHRARLGLPPYVPMNEPLLPRPALVRRIFRERVLERPGHRRR
jgi:hypothetical protein